ncbi:Chitinase 2 [Linderina pennispora]|nr:Chitinase 2 [Linderina pennispora]
MTFARYLLAAAGLAAVASAAYNPTCSNNIVTYWGQNSWGGGHLNDPANWEKDLAAYCQDDTFDIINLSFVTNYNLTGLPILNHANHCETPFPNTKTMHCPAIGADIKTCQAKGKKIVLSLGGGGIYSYSLGTAAEGKQFADTVWNMFLGGSHQYRPYDDAVLDGVDLDIESGAHDGYVAFVNQLRTYFNGASKKYIISAAPQCVFPDANLGTTLSGAWIDNDYVQFYNNPCNLANINNQWNFDYKSWDTLTKANPNPNSKMYVGLPAGSGAAGNGYLDLNTLQADLKQLYTNYTSTFGGIMLWDASWYSNNQAYVSSLASWVRANMKCGSTPPTSTTTTVGPTSTTSAIPTSTTKTSVGPTSITSTIPTSSAPITTTTATPTSSSAAPTSTTSTSGTGPVAGGPCSSQNTFQCADSTGKNSAYFICNNGAWLQQACGSGTACFQSGSSIYCNWPSA